MRAIQVFSDAMDAFETAMDAAVTDIQAEIATMQATITDLQNSTGSITPEDQTRLDTIQAKAQVVKDKLAALDTITPPTLPASALKS